jgi:4-amino-4-deoxy-L-arabinose transferase-like glycosyltransferase
MTIKTSNKFALVVILILWISLFFHVLSLTKLPIFADEAIYIRWTQLIIDDWKQYLFFPLNDGKTPLQFWLMLPWQFLPLNQLASARLFSVFVGLFQILSMIWVTWILKGKKQAMFFTAVFTAFLPFWYFQHGMVLLDNLMTLWLTLFLGFSLLMIQKNSHSLVTKRRVLLAGLAGLAFGLALLTKIPAVLAVPSLSLVLFYKMKLKDILSRTLLLAFSFTVGILLFLTLALHPAFGQLFARGGDFLFSISDIVYDQAWRQTLPSSVNYFNIFWVYLTPAVVLLNISSLFVRKNQARSHLLFWMGVVFLFPIVLMGKVVYSRYLFPASIFFTLNAALAIESIFEVIKSKSVNAKQIVVSLTIALLIANTASASANFIFYSIVNPSLLPLVSSDQEQYLYQWSAGYGIVEVTQLIQSLAQYQKVAVATEGSFGTLPDGIMAYLHRENVKNIFVDGIGFPLQTIPDSFVNIAQSRSFERFILVANSDRLKNSKIPYKNFKLLAEYCRPENSECLQVWDFTDFPKPTDIPNL